MGVRRAVELASRVAANARDRRVYTLGSLIHNSRVLEDLKARGVESLEQERLPSNLEGSLIVVRAHGVAPEIEARLSARGAELVDATCPRVKASQRKALLLSQKGFHIFLAGEKHHAEIAGLRGYALAGNGFCEVVEDAHEAEAAATALFARNSAAKTALIGQTTMNSVEYSGISAAIRRFFPETTVLDTICGATKERQDALCALCTEVDCMIIVGGRNSANTRHLLDIARAKGKRAFLVEDADEIASLSSELEGLETAGLSAGASTPDVVIAEVEQALLAKTYEKR
jgi:4-hydroxy-3-methylbut-2-enyl diphosphate reductase